MSTEYGDDAQQMRGKLNSVSPSFCLAKWLQVSLHLPQGRTQSCYHPPTHAIPVELLKKNPGVLHNTPIKIAERKQMMAGVQPPGCSYCWKIEGAKSDDPQGHLSDRHYRSSEWWSAPALEEITTAGADWDGAPRYVEVNFNQACNFKCMYCSPHLSTSWQEEIEKFGPYKLAGSKIDGKAEHNDLISLERDGLMPLKLAGKDNPYVQAFWEWWPTIYRKLRVFRMTGGEPLMDKNTFKILDYVNEHPHGQLELSITSNFCPPDQKLFDTFLDKVKKLEEIRVWDDPEIFNENSGNYAYVAPAYKHFMLFVSLDGIGEQAEYMRSGLDYTRLINNVRTFLRETQHTSISFINTFNLLSIPSLQGFMELILELRQEFGGKNQERIMISPAPSHDVVHPPYEVKKFQRVWFDIPMLRYPEWFSIQNAKEPEKQEVVDVLEFMESHVQDEHYHETFEGFKPYEILKLKRNIAVMNEDINMSASKMNNDNLVMFITEYDRRKNLSFTTTFPTLGAYV